MQGMLIEQLKEQIETISTLFYQRKDKEAWEGLNGIIDLILQLMNTVADQEVTAKMNQGLLGIVAAMERKDTILIADELAHTIRPLLNTLED